MILVNDLGDGFPTFPQFQRMLQDYEAAVPFVPPTMTVKAPKVGPATAPLAPAIAAPNVPAWVEPPGLSVWSDGQTRCVHGVEVFRVCRTCRTYLQTVQRYCDTEPTE